MHFFRGNALVPTTRPDNMEDFQRKKNVPGTLTGASIVASRTSAATLFPLKRNGGGGDADALLAKRLGK